MIFNQICDSGGGTKNVRVNPGTSIETAGSVNYTITFNGLTQANIKGWCVVVSMTKEQNEAVSCGILTISRSGETAFQNYGNKNFSITQDYNPSSGTVVMHVNSVYSGLTNFVLAFD